jgi:two-component system chemotaxis response regulator CheY
MKTALIVDDSQFMRDRLREILEDLEKVVIGEALNGKDAVHLYKEHKPDMVFLDINMPELSGKDALVQIMDFDPKANIIMCSSLGSEKIVAECIEEGAVYYILKPFVRNKVEEVINAISEAV